MDGMDWTSSAGLLMARIDAFAAAKGYARPGSIPAAMSFREWCEDLAKKGLKVDRRPFSLANRQALIPIYDAIPTTAAQAHRQTLVVQKATQLGLTIWEVLADLYMAKKFGPINIGMFLPDQATAAFKSEHRFMPVLRSAPELHKELTHRINDDGTIDKIGEGNVLTRAFAHSLFMFLWTSGKVTTESRPMDIVSLDEVQEMTLAMIDKVIARMGDSDLSYSLMLSTANMPDLDINFWYKLGTQEVWHTRCLRCDRLSDLSDPAGIFPSKSIGYDLGEREYHWRCPRCEARIADPQVGEYVAQNPAAIESGIRSFMLPRTISPRMTPREMRERWDRAVTGDQKKSFFNRTLARPFIDPSQIPVTLAHCEACVKEGMRVGLRWETEAADTYMGVDQMGGWNAHIIKRRLPDGRQAVVHVEATFGDNPFARTEELMKQYGVAVCVVEQLPNVNDARRLANKFPGRVFLAGYAGDPKSDMVSWGDAITRSDIKTAADDRSRFTVTLQQYKAMQTALYRIRDTFCLFPDPSEFYADVMDGGEPKRILLVRDWVFHHFTKTALVVEQDDETRKLSPKVLKIGIDPHYSFANMLCDVAWSRNHGTGSFFMPNNPDNPPPNSSRAEAVAAAMPGLPEHVVRMIDDIPEGTCGRCSAYAPDGEHAGMCTLRSFKVARADVGCDFFDRKEEE